MRWDISAREQSRCGRQEWLSGLGYSASTCRDIGRPAAAKAGGEVKVEANHISGGSSRIGLSSSRVSLELDYRTFSLSVMSYIVLKMTKRTTSQYAKCNGLSVLLAG